MTVKVQRGIIQKILMQELWFLRSAHRVMLFDDKMKCLEDILNKN